MLTKIAEVPGFAKDMQNRAVVSTDTGALKAYKQKRADFERLKASLEDINTLRNEVLELRDLVNRLLQDRAK